MLSSLVLCTRHPIHVIVNRQIAYCVWNWLLYRLTLNFEQHYCCHFKLAMRSCRRCMRAQVTWYLNILVPRARRFLVTWSGNEGLWKQPLPDVRKFLTSGRACAEAANMTTHAHNGFLSLTAPLGEKFYFLSSLQRVGCFENAPLGFTDDLELKKEDSNRIRLNTLLVCRTETINRQTIFWVVWVFFSIRLTNKHWESNIAKIDIMREKVNLKRYLVPCPATAILLMNTFWNKTIHVLC